MSKNPILSDQIDHYVNQVMTRESDIQKRLRHETARMPQHQMQTTPDQMAFIALLIRIMQATSILEIGTFTGYSALTMAAALPEHGKLVACDISREWTDIAQRYWQEADVTSRVELHIGPAQDTLHGFLQAGMAERFDLAFIDADKKTYDSYYEACLKLVRAGGVILFDNMLWGGAVADTSQQDGQTVAIRKLNEKIRDDSRVEACLLTVADGLLMVRKH